MPTTHPSSSPAHSAGRRSIAPWAARSRTQKAAVLGALVSLLGAGTAAAATTSGAASGAEATTGVYAGSPTPSMPSDPDHNPVEVGLKFRTTTPGTVVGVRYYKAADNTGTHRVTLWDATGHSLASRAVSSTSTAGWRTVRFGSPVHITSGRTFTASYHTPTGHYASREGAFADGPSGSVVQGLAGVYHYGAHAFPTDQWHHSEYYVEPVFRADTATDAGTTTPPTTTTSPTTTAPTTAAPTAPTSPTTTAPSSPTSPTTTSPTAPSSPTAPTTSTGTTTTSTGYPDASSTGVTSAPTKTMSGTTITTDGTTLSNVQVNGQLTIRAANVTLDNVQVNASGTYGILVEGKNLQITDSTIKGSGGTLAGLAAANGGSFTAKRIDVSGTEDGVRLADNCTLQDSYVHDLQGSSSSHFDAVTADGFTGWNISHNTILNQNGQTAAVWVGDPRYSPGSGVLKGNLLGGGGYTIYGGPGTSAGIQVVDNAFTTRYFSRSGSYGVVAAWSTTNTTWSGNTWYDGPNKGQTVQP